MANHYRILCAVFAKEDEPVRSFLNRLKAGGWREYVEIPVPHDGECGFAYVESDTEAEPPTCGTCQHRAWGSILFPDIRILTGEGVSEINDCRFLPQFAHADPFDQADAVISSESYPGFTDPEPTDHIAVLMGESRGGFPHQWFKQVIESSYEAGLRFFARCYDFVDASYGDCEIGRSVVFHSSDEAGHYAAWTEDPGRVADASGEETGQPESKLEKLRRKMREPVKPIAGECIHDWDENPDCPDCRAQANEDGSSADDLIGRDPYEGIASEAEFDQWRASQSDADMKDFARIFGEQLTWPVIFKHRVARFGVKVREGDRSTQRTAQIQESEDKRAAR